jgi:dTDP-4-amino-4,6-dideoxygalactose transaminase
MSIVFNDFQKEVAARRPKYQAAIDRVLDSGWFILGKEVQAFEAEFAKYLGVNKTVGVANGLEALQIALMALKISKGDEVITTPISAVATTLAIQAVGAVPVFVDVTPDGLLNPELLEAAITPKTKAVIPVHLYGNAADLAAINQVCQKHNLILIEDAAQAHGTQFQGQRVGKLGKLSGFSFYPTKNLGAFGDGGAISTDDEELAHICAEIRDYGQERKYYHTRLGLNSRLDEIHAAILRVKLGYLDEDNHQRQALATEYDSHLADVNESDLKLVRPWNRQGSNIHLYVVRTPKRDELQKYLSDHGIPSLVHYPLAIPDQPFLASQFADLHLPESRRLVKEVLSLPCHPQMTSAEVEGVANAVKAFFKQ